MKIVWDEGFNPDHYYARAHTQLIIDLAAVEHKREEEEKREETREKAISIFLKLDVRSFIPTGMIKY